VLNTGPQSDPAKLPRGAPPSTRYGKQSSNRPLLDGPRVQRTRPARCNPRRVPRAPSRRGASGDCRSPHPGRIGGSQARTSAPSRWRHLEGPHRGESRQVESSQPESAPENVVPSRLGFLDVPTGQDHTRAPRARRLAMPRGRGRCSLQSRRSSVHRTCARFKVSRHYRLLVRMRDGTAHCIIVCSFSTSRQYSPITNGPVEAVPSSE
jgi:hypothetical protein